MPSATVQHNRKPELHDRGADIARPERHLTDLGNAQRIVDRHGNQLRYCYPLKSWFAWDGRRWCPDQTGEIVRRVKETQAGLFRWATKKLQELGEADGDEEKRERAKALMAILRHVLCWEAARSVAASIDLARSEPGIPVLPDELDSDPFLLNVQNGTIDLRTGRLREHRQADLISKLAPVAFDPDAECPLWERCLARWMDGNSALIRYLQRVVGYSLTGDVGEQCLFFLHGAGANGKSTLLGCIKDLLGDYAMQSVAELLIQRGHEQHPTERADLFGRRFVTTIETDQGKRMAEALMKQLTGGDSLRARKMRQDFTEARPTWKIFLAANHKPNIHGTDYAVWRRIRLVPFTVTIAEDEKDRRLLENLRAEFSGILNWAVSGCLEWQRDGLGEPAEVRQATADYQAEQDTIGEFLLECCVTGREYRVRVTDMFAAYRHWCERNGQREGRGTEFGLAMTSRGIARDAGRRWYLNIAMRIEEGDQISAK